MKPINTRILCLALGLALGGMSPGCATVGPIAIKCGIADVQIAAADYTEISADFHAKPVNWTDLASVAERLGYATFDCVANDQAAKDPTIKPAVQEFKAKHAAEFRSAGVSACNFADPGTFLVNPPPCYLPGVTKLRSRPGTCVETSRDGALGVVASDGRFIPIVQADPATLSLASCSASCGSSDALAPPSGCMCRRGRGMNARWVALR
jgi:hypothetical protein